MMNKSAMARTAAMHNLQVHVRNLVSLPPSLRKHKSAAVFLLSNLVWVIGVLFLGWSAFDLLFIFWLEAGVMEIFVVVKLILFRCLWKPDWEPKMRVRPGEANRGTVFFVTVMTVMGAFFGVPFTVLWIIMGAQVTAMREGGRSVGAFSDALHAITGEFAAPFWSMVAAYTFSLAYDYLYRGEIRKVVDGDYIFKIILAPLFRVFTIISLSFVGLWVVILVGAVGQLFGQTDAAVNFGWALALCVSKLWVDAACHPAERVVIER